MRRADRLFQIVQLLRRERAVTAAELGRELEVSERTIYRDVQDLVLSGVPIQGEAGVGYALPESFDLPPLMFDREEIQALALGMRMVESWSDERLARAARSALAKVEHVLPPRLASRVAKTRLFAPGFFVSKPALAALTTMRDALDEHRVLRLDYRDENGKTSSRDVRPLALAFWGRSWTLTAWCELRTDFRSFRIDRASSAKALARTFEDEPGRTFDDFLARIAADRSSSERVEATDAKAPQLELTRDERRALQRAKLTTKQLGGLTADTLHRRTQGEIAAERCAELVSLAEFQRLGSVGAATAGDFLQLGFHTISDLVGRDPRELFVCLQQLTHSKQDPCVEDAFRCAIAQAEHPDLPTPWRAWHRWTPLRGTPAGTLPPELAQSSHRETSPHRSHRAK
ncbi:MAG: WYL domain-containing protein [Planctomycetes bacterium]|nr:WYL domain-containing protein [Planctomycetota bacterium]